MIDDNMCTEPVIINGCIDRILPRFLPLFVRELRLFSWVSGPVVEPLRREPSERLPSPRGGGVVVDMTAADGAFEPSQEDDLPHPSCDTEWWYVNMHFSLDDGVGCASGGDVGSRFSLFACFFRTIKAWSPEQKDPLHAHALNWAIVDSAEQRCSFCVCVRARVCVSACGVLSSSSYRSA